MDQKTKKALNEVVKFAKEHDVDDEHYDAYMTVIDWLQFSV